MRDYLRRTLSGQLPLFSLGSDNAVVQVGRLAVGMLGTVCRFCGASIRWRCGADSAMVQVAARCLVTVWLAWCVAHMRGPGTMRIARLCCRLPAIQPVRIHNLPAAAGQGRASAGREPSGLQKGAHSTAVWWLQTKQPTPRLLAIPPLESISGCTQAARRPGCAACQLPARCTAHIATS